MPPGPVASEFTRLSLILSQKISKSKTMHISVRYKADERLDGNAEVDDINGTCRQMNLS